MSDALQLDEDNELEQDMEKLQGNLEKRQKRFIGETRSERQCTPEYVETVKSSIAARAKLNLSEKVREPRMRNVIKTLVTVGVLSFSILLAYGLVATSPVPETIVPEEHKNNKSGASCAGRNKPRGGITGNSGSSQAELLVPKLTVSQLMSPHDRGVFQKGDILLKIDSGDLLRGARFSKVTKGSGRGRVSEI